MTEHPAPWLGEILRTAGNISPATASEIRQAAEYTYQQRDGERGGAWAQYAARQAAKSVLAGIATESDPAVQAAFRRYQEAEEHSDRLYAAAAGPDGKAGLDTLDKVGARKWMDADVAAHEARVLYEAYHETYMAARPRHDTKVRKAWRQADKDFVSSYRAELQAADPAVFKQVFGNFTEDSSPSAAPAPTSPLAGPGETTARHAQGTPNSSRNGPANTEGAEGPQARPFPGFRSSPPPTAEEAPAYSAVRPSARWLASASFPAAPARPGTGPARTTRPPSQQAPRQASGRSR